MHDKVDWNARICVKIICAVLTKEPMVVPTTLPRTVSLMLDV